MTNNRLLISVSLLSALASAAFVWLTPMPLPFTGFSIVAAAGLAALCTLTVLSWMPPRWVWSDAELLRLAFQNRHGISEYAADSALEAITKAHARAENLRNLSAAMREDAAKRISSVSDRLDAAAREIFYTPDRHRQLRNVLTRSVLIEEAATAHAALRKRKQVQTETVSRAKLIAAVDALEAAFDQTDLLAARGLLADVDTASSVAETLLRPMRRLETLNDSNASVKQELQR
ncbi:hypothetical protein [Cognatishimia sp.]|uniref:hypothetical protein n=1 Tax=Cognatishimia sp. TaxID=2211648 RepID=UPI00351641F2